MISSVHTHSYAQILKWSQDPKRTVGQEQGGIQANVAADVRQADFWKKIEFRLLTSAAKACPPDSSTLRGSADNLARAFRTRD